MNTRAKMRFPLALVLLGSLAAAQGAAKTPLPSKSPPAAGHEQSITLRFHVTGLTADNLNKVRDSLVALDYTTYACDHCGIQRAMYGKCPQCGAEMKLEKRKLFSSVTPAPKDSTITLVLDPEHRTRFSQIERTLRSDAVAVDEGTVPIAGQAELVLRGGKADGVAAVEKALKEAKLFDELHASWDASSGEIHVAARAGATSPTRARVDSAIHGLEVQVRDVVWGRAPMKT